MLKRWTATARLESLTMTSADEANAKGTLNSAPSTKPTVRFPVKNEATMPMASIAQPTTQ